MTATTSYYRANSPQDPSLSRYVFFDDRDEKACEAAYAAACVLAREMGGHVSVFRPTLPAGPWDAAQVIGHRRRITLEACFEEAETPEEVATARAELAMLDAAFSKRRAPRGNLKAVIS